MTGCESACVCSTGWITHFGESMANTSAQDLALGLRSVLQFANGTGSVNLYMAHGGSNWGFYAGMIPFLWTQACQRFRQSLRCTNVWPHLQINWDAAHHCCPLCPSQEGQEGKRMNISCTWQQIDAC